MKINGGLIKAYSQMGQKGAASGIGMLEVVKRNPDVVAGVGGGGGGGRRGPNKREKRDREESAGEGEKRKEGGGRGIVL